VKCHDKISYGDITKYCFTPQFKSGKWYITEVRNITIYADREWSDPECILSLKCEVTVMTGKKDKGWLVPGYEIYNNVWVDMERGEFINYVENEKNNQSFRYQQKIPAENAAAVLAKMRDKMNMFFSHVLLLGMEFLYGYVIVM
jgi:hypothetical protein